MTAATIAKTPQLHTARQLRDAIRADFLTRGIAAVVELGEWDPEMLRGAARVMINLADGTIGQPAGHWQPGLQVRVNERDAYVSIPVVTLAGGSTITSTRTGTPTGSGSFVILFSTGGVTGLGSDIEYSLSVDNGTTFEAPVPLEADTTITIFGSVFDLGSGTTATAGDTIAWTQRRASFDIARPILDRTRGFLLRIHAPAPSNPADAFRAEAAQDATDQLLSYTQIAVVRVVASSLRGNMREHWPETFPRYPAFVHGSMCELSFVIGAPLLDDAHGIGLAIEASTTTDVLYADGSTSPGSTTTVPIP